MEKKTKLEQDKEVQSIVLATSDLEKQAKGIEVINTPEIQVIASDVLVDAKKAIKLIKEKGKFYSQPHKDFAKNIDNRAKEYARPFETIKDNIEEKLRIYQRQLLIAKQKEEEKLQKKTEKAIENNKPIPVSTVPHVDKSIKSENVTTSIIDNWKAEITNKLELIKFAVRTERWELLNINESELNRLAKLYKDTKVIPGCLVFNKEKVSSRKV